MSYNYKNNEMWTVTVTDKEMNEFTSPYIGNGHMGSTFNKLVFSDSFDKPLLCVSKDFYDDGAAIYIPAWNTIELSIDGIDYKYINGKHSVNQVLDLRTATVTMKDKWFYNKNESIDIEVCMFIPRQVKSGSYLSVKINSSKKATLKFGLNGVTTKEAANLEFANNDNYLNGKYTTLANSKVYKQTLKWNTKNIDIKEVNKSEDKIVVVANTNNTESFIELFHSFSDNSIEVVDSMDLTGFVKLSEDNTSMWKSIWDNAVAFNDKFEEYAKIFLIHQYYLLASFSEDGSYAISPCGISQNAWNGVQFWDTDIYMFRAMLAINLDFAKSNNLFRYKTLEKAKTRAKIDGFKGAKYPWKSDSDGFDNTPPIWRDEIHINIWIALAMWEYYLTTKDLKYLETYGYEVITNIADFLHSWSYPSGDGKLHMQMVVPPDENVCQKGPGRCSDNFLTNYGSKKIMEIAIEVCELLDKAPNKKWSDFIDRIYLLSPDENGIINEYEGYNGADIKQADTILAFYPLDMKTDKDIIKKNVEYYNKKIKFGPSMTTQFESIIKIKYLDSNKDTEIVEMFERFKPNMKGPHYVVFEVPTIYGGDCSVFLTAIGAELQAVIYGYYNCEPGDFSNLPRIKDYN